MYKKLGPYWITVSVSAPLLLDRLPNKNTEGTRGNDWTCPKCGNVNFSFRTDCNMRKCNTEKPGSQAVKPWKNSKPEMPEGSWKCEKCNNINYPFRIKCKRQNCGADKSSDTKKSPSEPVDDNDQSVESFALHADLLKPDTFEFIEKHNLHDTIREKANNKVALYAVEEEKKEVAAKPLPEPEKTIEAASVKQPKAEECDEGEDEDGDLKGV
ncbi:hypothetical protein POM88_025422 [Heracleum sosnowskyi]|uniref:RanBP2-type domain-containing protein n=1 Tax=Heracleum sosnowskyi TaxID=360622 RepID=A0AAD8MNT1_9APIA|nr:hypothetical protein POM88_025422 [Heracleum sosnowskyi]